MIFLQAASRPTGPAAACLRLVETGAVNLLISDDILGETQEVLARRKCDRRTRVSPTNRSSGC